VEENFGTLLTREKGLLTYYLLISSYTDFLHHHVAFSLRWNCLLSNKISLNSETFTGKFCANFDSEQIFSNIKVAIVVLCFLLFYTFFSWRFIVAVPYPKKDYDLSRCRSHN